MEGDGAASQLAAVVELGEVGPARRLQDGSLRWRWRIPAGLTPRRLAAAIIDREHDRVAFITVAVSRRARFRVWTGPDAEIQVTMGGKVVAKGRADAQGHLQLSVLVPPGTDAAALQQRLRNARQQQDHELGLQDQLRLWGVPRIEPLVADGSPQDLYFVCYRDGGEPCGAEHLVVQAGAATEQEATSIAPDVFRATVQAGPYPQESVVPKELVLRAEAQVAGEQASFNMQVELVAPAAVRIDVEPPPASIEAGAYASLVVHLRDSTGRAVSDTDLAAEVPHGRIVSVQKEAGGAYRVLFLAPRELPSSALLPVLLSAEGAKLNKRVDLKMTASPPWVLQLHVQAARGEQRLLHLQANDRFGNPVVLDAAQWRADAGQLQPRGGDAVVMLWQPGPGQRDGPVRVSVTGTALGHSADAETTLLFRHLRSPVGGALAAGMISDLESFVAPTVGLQLLAQGTDWGALQASARFALAYATRSQSVRVLPQQEPGRLLRSLWALDTTLGLAYPFLAWHRWRVLGELASGVRASSVSSLLSVAQRRSKNGPTFGAAWLAQATLTLRYVLSVGSVDLSLTGADTLTRAKGFSARPANLGLSVGYTYPP